MRAKVTSEYDLSLSNLLLLNNKEIVFKKTQLKKSDFYKSNLFSIFFLLPIFFISIESYSQLTLNTRQSGNWNSVNTWVSSNLSGRISTSTTTNRTTVTGNGTNFLTQLQVGLILYRTDGVTVIGTIAAINSNTSITLTANAANSNTNVNYVTRKIPTVLDTAILSINGVFTIPSDYAASCATLEIGVSVSNSAQSLNFADATASLVVTGNATIFGPSSGSVREIQLNAGSMSVGGNLSFGIGQGGTQSNRVTKLTISTGTISVEGNLYFTTFSISSSVLQTQINMTDGIFNLAGNFIINNNIGTLSMGTASIFNFNGSTAQTIPIGISNIVYSNLNINNTSFEGATLSAAIAISNVTENLSIQSGSLNNGGFAIVGTSSKTISVANGAALILSETTAFPTGFSTTTLGNSSTVNYIGTNQTVAIKSYGNLALSTSGNKTFNGGITIAGNLAISGTAKALLPNGTISFADTITLGGIDQSASGSWGSLGSSATNKTNIWFVALNSGIVNISRPCSVTTATAGINQSNCSLSSFTMSGNNVAGDETGTWTLVSGTATIENLTSSTSIVSDVTEGTSATLRWTITKTVGECKSSDDVVLTVNPIAIPGTISNNTSVCPGINSTTISLTGNTGAIQWQSSSDNIIYSNISGASNSNLEVTNLTESAYYKAVVTNGNCSVNSNSTQIAIKNTTFDGANWSNGLPDATSSITFNLTGNYTINSDISVCSCTINNGNVVVASNKTMTLLNSLNVINGSITFEDKSSLVQTNNVVNSGQILYKRNTSSLFNNYDFVYWSSPVANQTLNTIWMSPNSNNTFYTYNNTANNWAGANANSVMQPGVGYIARARSGASGLDYAGVSTTFNLGSTWQAKFYGTPNNGNYSLPVYKTGNDYSNLIGNPYPSAINMKLFNDDADNFGKLTGNFLFWTHSTSISANVYNASDYAIYNANTSVSVSGNRGFFPDQFIDSGQSFFVEAIGNGILTFKNSHRVTGNNSGFYRSASANNTTTTIESHNIWLNLSNSEGAFKQQLVQYAQGATAGYDLYFDAISAQGNPNLDFYSSIPNYKFTLQSKALPFDISNTVNLGYKVATAGTYLIEIDNLDGLFLDGQNIYLEDSQTNQLIDLKAAPYSFQTTVGEYPNRFVLHYLPIVLETENSNFENSVQLLTNDKSSVYSSILNIKKIVVFDVLGRIIDSYKNINMKQFVLDNLNKAMSTKIVKITLENDAVVIKKLIF